MLLGNEKIAADSMIGFDGVDSQISLSEALVKNFYMFSDKKKVQSATELGCDFMIA